MKMLQKGEKNDVVEKLKAKVHRYWTDASTSRFGFMETRTRPEPMLGKPTATHPLEAPAIRATRKSSFVEPLEHATREHIAIRGGDHTDEAREHTQISTHDETCSMSRTVRRVLRVQRISGEEDDQHDSPPHEVDNQNFCIPQNKKTIDPDVTLDASRSTSLTSIFSPVGCIRSLTKSKARKL